MVFQTPIARRLSEEDGEVLIKAYIKLAADYNGGRLDAECIDRIKEQNNVRAKVGMIRKNRKRSQ